MRYRKLFVLMFSLVLFFFLGMSNSAQGRSLLRGKPTNPGGNVSCPAGYESFKIDDIESDYTGGTYDLDGGGSITVYAYDAAKMIKWESDGLLVYYVYVKGGSKLASEYKYDDGATEDFSKYLVSPLNRGGRIPTISHITFCYRYQLVVSKTAKTSFNRYWTWDIDKKGYIDEVETTEIIAEIGEEVSVDYEIELDAKDKDDDFLVSGVVTIYNPSTMHSAIISSVIDEIEIGATKSEIDIECEWFDEVPYILGPQQTVYCDYSEELDDNSDGSNHVEVVVSPESKVYGNSATADIIFSDEPTEEFDEIVTVEDDQYEWNEGVLGVLDATKDELPHIFEYTKVFSYEECGIEDYENIASFTSNDNDLTGEDSHKIEIDILCELIVSKTVETYFEQVWEWDIEKWGSEILLENPNYIGGLFPVNYEVTLSADSEYQNFMVSGIITIHNPSSDYDATIASIEDIISYDGKDITVSLECDEELPNFPLTLVKEETLECEYGATIPDGYPGLVGENTVTVETDEAGMVLGSYAIEDVIFSNIANEQIDDEVEVDDDPYGDLGTVKSTDLNVQGRHMIPYTYGWEVEQCGTDQYINTVSFVTNTTQTQGSDDWTIEVDIPCIFACTYTQGYWKTHSSYGPAPYDPIWVNIGEDTTFYLSGQTYYQVINTSSAGGNAYYILAQQYIATTLNSIKNTGLPQDIQDAWDDATSLFETYTPSDISGLSGDDLLRQEFIALSQLLDSYNNGNEGVPHCSDWELGQEYME